MNLTGEELKNQTISRGGKRFVKKIALEMSTVAHFYNPSTRKSEAGGSRVL
jgi:hypothetical protein